MERLSNYAGLTPSSQSAGGEVHNNLAMTAPGTPPGGDFGQFAAPVSVDAEPAGQSGPSIPVPTQPVTGPRGPAASGAYPDRGSTVGQPRDGAGRWAPDDQIAGASAWRPTPAAGAL
jgi:hypothetical protein